MRRIEDAMVNLHGEIKYFKMRERTHRNTTESTNARVLWWSFLEALVLFGTTAWQVFSIRRFLEVKRTV